MISDDKLVKNVVKKACSDSFQTLLDRHSLLFYKVIHGFSNALEFRKINIQDLFDEKEYLFWRWCRSYKPGKSKFITWVGNQTRYMCLNLLKRRKFETYSWQEIDEIPLEYHLDVTIPPDEEVLGRVRQIISEFPDKRIKRIYKMRYAKNKASWAKISKVVDLSIQGAIDLHNRARDIIAKTIKQEELA